MKENLLRHISVLTCRHAGKVIVFFLLLTFAALYPLSRLELSMRWSDMLPREAKSVKEYNNILDKYSSASSLILTLKGPKDKIIEKADVLVKKLRAINHPLIKRVDGENNREFLLKTALKIMKSKDLNNNKELFYNPNLADFFRGLNHSLEKTYIFSDDEEKLSNREKKDNAINTMEVIHDLVLMLDREGKVEGKVRSVMERVFSGERYLFSYSKEMLIINIIPNFPVTETGKASELTRFTRDLMNEVLAGDEDVKGGLTGILAIMSDELDTMENMNLITGIAFLLIIMVFVLAFRIWVTPLMAGAVLIVSVVLSGASAYFFYEGLNLMTSMFAVILFGLIIDFSIHIISQFRESMDHYGDLKTAIEKALHKSGGGILIGGVTTSFCFSVLLLTENRGMKEFGGVVGGGILIGMIVTLVLLPALMVVYYRKFQYKKKRVVELDFLGKSAAWMTKRSVISLVSLALLVAVFIFYPGQVTFDYNILNIEPPDMQSVTWFYDIVDEYDLSTDQAMISIPLDSMDQARDIVEKAKNYKSIAITQSITEYLPSPEKFTRNSEMIEEIKEIYEKNKKKKSYSLEDASIMIEILDTLWMNVTEMGALAFQKGRERLEKKCYVITKDPGKEAEEDYLLSVIEKFKKDPEKMIQSVNKMQDLFYPVYSQLLNRVLNTDPVDMGRLPDDIRSRFVSNDGKETLISFYSQDNVWDFVKLKSFRKVLENINENITGTPVMFLDLIDLIGKDGKTVMILSVVLIFILLLVDFRSFLAALAAMVPLGLSLAGLLFFMKLFHIQIDIVNILALPLILGIGIDDGVHFTHRYLAEEGKMDVAYRTTGKAALITTITTVIGFGSLYFIPHRGMSVMGLLLVIGISLCWLMTVLFLAPFFGLLNFGKEK